MAVSCMFKSSRLHINCKEILVKFFTKSHPGSSVSGRIGQIAHVSKDVSSVECVHGCKYLHLKSQHNALADDTE